MICYRSYYRSCWRNCCVSCCRSRCRSWISCRWCCRNLCTILRRRFAQRHDCAHVPCRKLIVALHCLKFVVQVLFVLLQVLYQISLFPLRTNLHFLNSSFKLGTVRSFHLRRLILLHSLPGVPAWGVSDLFFPSPDLSLCTLSFVRKVTLPFFFTCCSFQARNTTAKRAWIVFFRKTWYTDTACTVDNEQSLHNCMNSVQRWELSMTSFLLFLNAFFGFLSNASVLNALLRLFKKKCQTWKTDRWPK